MHEANKQLMKIKLLLAFMLYPVCIYAQERVSIKGRIINEQGEAVEYVQIGMPKLQTGTISSADGRFEIEVPCDTLEFFHVSYRPISYPVTGPADNVVIVMKEQELPPAIFIGGKTKEKYLLKPGAKVLRNLGIISLALRDGHPSGRELGSVAQARKPFLVKDIYLSIHSNNIPDCVASVNIYRIEGKKESFVNVLHKPVYFHVAVSNEPQHFHLEPEETLLLEPGKYFISFQIVDCDSDAVQEYPATMDFDIHLKNSYLREAALGEMKHSPVNIGVAVKGVEIMENNK